LPTFISIISQIASNCLAVQETKITLKVGVVGLGFMGSAHARVYSQLDECELVAICDINRSKKQLAKAYNCKFIEDLQGFFDEDLDAISVCTPTSTHKNLVLRALENGKHVLVEKPLADNLGNGEAMVKKAAKMNRLLAIGYIERFNPAVSRLREIVDFSQIYSTVSIRFGPFPPRIKDIGVFLDLASHEIDLLNYLTKIQPEVLYTHVSSSQNSTFEDYAYISLKYGQIHSHIETSWLPNYKLRFIHLYGNREFYTLNYAQQNLKSCRPPPKAKMEHGSWKDILWLSRNVEETIPVSSNEPLKLELKCFIESIKENRVLNPLCNPQDGLQILKIAETAFNKLK
jgi:UDP-N-acetylglucosamine 3-dehydrogenase